MLQFPEIVSPLSASVGTSGADRSRAITASFLPPLARPTAADRAPPAPTTALHRVQRVHGRHHDHHWAATNAATRKARSRTRGVPLDGRRRGNNDVWRRARAQRGRGGRLPRARAARNKCLSARPRARYKLMRCTLATTPRRYLRGGRQRSAALGGGADCALPWRPQRAGRRQGPPRGYCARAAASTGRARAILRAWTHRSRRRAAAAAPSP